MGKYVATEFVKLMMRKDLKVINSKILILGFTFKENCPDVRNTRVIDIYKELINFDIKVEIYDPWASQDEVIKEYGIELLKTTPSGYYSGVILAVAHQEFLNIDVRALSPKGVVFDIKGVLSKNDIDSRL
jgi:UDP-N-acetyl-D-galactosamine dehydrogenase